MGTLQYPKCGGKINIGIIGIGSMGKNHVRVCSEKDDIELVGVVDKNIKTMKTIVKKFEVVPFFDYKKLLPKVDAVIIATPTSTHHKIALNCINHGKHVLIEKPICNNIEKAKDLINSSEKNDVVLSVGHIERHNPAVKFIKESLDKNKFGKLITIASKRVSNYPGRIKDMGVISDLGVHDIDVMNYIAGNVQFVYANAGRIKNNLFEDYANIILSFEKGICGVIEVNWLTPMKIRKLFLTCSKKFVEMDYINQSVKISSSSFHDIDDSNLYDIPMQYNTNEIVLEKKEPLKNEIEDFIDSIKNNHKPLVTGYDGLETIKIAQSAIKSYKQKKVMEIDT